MEASDPADAAAGAPAPPDPQPALAVVIDDVGLDRAAFEAAMAIDAPLTFAILPYAPEAPEFARAASAAGREVFLHLPMEPRGLADPGPRALTKALSPTEVSTRTAWALNRVPGAAGVNNHMGSRLTADRAAVSEALAPLEGRGLVFLDSMTSPDSVAAEAAASLGIPALRRDVFLDNDRSPEAVSAAFDAALERAVKQGRAVAIGHPHPETLAVLSEARARAEAAGVRLTTVSALAAPEDA
ncbi:divergent polysaccharide deacetylase family protein [Marinicauda salina]|uniref:divergent polysaccharide deacetylase family protein n=1 Tax=Marinicauda salina TaxID=2135793 RepID=UPI001304C417|nr:divergent polysaccharide deacetylase family protein [Marinicauda salina]